MDEQSPRHHDAFQPETPPVGQPANEPAAAPNGGDRWALRVVEPGRPDRFAEWPDQPVNNPASSPRSSPPSDQRANPLARGCTLRLVTQTTGEPGEHSPACTFYRGATGPRVRAWSETVLLNGETIIDAEIQLGDRLAVGNLEFELIDVPLATLPVIEEPSFCELVRQEAPRDLEPSKDEISPARCRAIDVIPPRDHDDTDESVEEHLERLLKRVCGEDAARDFARQRERNLANLSSNADGDDATANSSHDHDDPFGARNRLNMELPSESPERNGRSTEWGESSDEASAVPAHRLAAEPPAMTLRPREVEADWSGMRELANQSARAAIETHQMKGVARSARSRLSAAVLFAVSGTIGLYVIPGDQWLPLLGVLMAYGTTVLWLLRTLRGSRTSRRVLAR